MANLPQFPELSIYRWSAPEGPRFPVYNPATGKVLTTIVGGTAKEVDEAVRTANTAFQSFKRKTPKERSQLLLSCASALEPHLDYLATLLCLENGKPKEAARQFDLNFLVNIFRYYASLIDKLPSEFYDEGPVYTHVHHEPYGVVAAILPFNWPPIHCGGKIAPALAMGNTVVIKPGEQAPLTVVRIVMILQSVLPKGVVDVVPGVGPDVPSALIEHELVHKVSFTGSTAAGAKVAETAAKDVTPLSLELGGKNAFVVFDDADLEQAVRDALEGGFFNKGEACTATSRILVQSRVHDQFVQKLGAGVKKLVVGDGLKKETHIGPQVTEVQQKKLEEYVKVGTEGGATIYAQGELPKDPDLKSGYFIRPTLFTNVKRDMRIAKEEMFGPIQTVTKFETFDEAMNIVNEPEYGLTCAIYTKDSEKGFRASREVDVGMCYINNYWRSVIGKPFGGAKQSGYGREHCIETLRDFSRPKFVQFRSGLGEPPAWYGVRDILDETKGQADGS
ncbi:MAG: hypothetical protein M1820_006639 [Bogoriella megaspora]|nr:MAG: hypothetical protein M1820_006639 [Bogoriella megaspora]